MLGFGGFGIGDAKTLVNKIPLMKNNRKKDSAVIFCLNIPFNCNINYYLSI